MAHTLTEFPTTHVIDLQGQIQTRHQMYNGECCLEIDVWLEEANHS